MSSILYEAVNDLISSRVDGRVGYYWEDTHPTLEVFSHCDEERAENVIKLINNRLDIEARITTDQVDTDYEIMEKGYYRFMMVFEPGRVTNDEVESMILILKDYGSPQHK